jgi:hypothetical protein
MPAEMTDRRFPPPWTLDEHDECFIVRDADGQALGYFYFDEEQQSPAIDRRLTRDDARRMAVNFAKLPDLVASRWLAWRSTLGRDLRKNRSRGYPMKCATAVSKSKATGFGVGPFSSGGDLKGA